VASYNIECIMGGSKPILLRVGGCYGVNPCFAHKVSRYDATALRLRLFYPAHKVYAVLISFSV